MAESSAGHMQVCTSFQTDNHTSTPPLSFLQAGCPSCRPTNSVKALKTSRSVDISCPHQQTHTRKPAVAACSGRLGQTDRETDTRQLHRTCTASYMAKSLQIQHKQSPGDIQDTFLRNSRRFLRNKLYNNPSDHNDPV